MKEKKILLIKSVVRLFEFIYLLGSVLLAFVPWIFMIWSFGLYPKSPTLELSWLIKSLAVWVLIPLVVFAGLLEMYVKSIKRKSRRLQKYGFLGYGLYTKRE